MNRISNFLKMLLKILSVTKNLSAHGRARPHSGGLAEESRGEKPKTENLKSKTFEGKYGKCPSFFSGTVFLLFFFAFVILSLLPFPLSKGGEGVVDVLKITPPGSAFPPVEGRPYVVALLRAATQGCPLRRGGEATKLSFGLWVFFLVFKVNYRSNCKNGDSDHYYEKANHSQSSFMGVIKTAAIRIMTEIKTVITTTTGFIDFSEIRIIAPRVVNRYFTRSKSRSATFSFLRKCLSFIDKFKHGASFLSTQNLELKTVFVAALLLCWSFVMVSLSNHAYAVDVDSYTKLLLKMDGSDGSTTISDSTGKTVTNPESYDSYTKLMLHFNGLGEGD